MNTIKSATKEPKVSKLPVPKPVPCALSKTSKNVTVGASDLKRSQIAHPGKFIDFLFYFLLWRTLKCHYQKYLLRSNF